jgi:predicted ATPase/DNA-binding winged helix-turn-helix (wHTH) protein
MTRPTNDGAGCASQDTWVASFGPFQLSASPRLLAKDGVPVHLGSRALSLLIALVDSAGRIVSKKELMARAWPDVIVDEGSLRVHMVAIRKALGDGLSETRYVTNVTSQGYCFVAPVTRSQPGVAPGAAAVPSDTANGLPASPLRMVGRETTAPLIQAEVQQKRFVTIVGPGGMGKTTVAAAVAHAMLPGFDGAVRFVDLAAVTDGAYVAGTIAATLGLAHSDAASGIVSYLRDKRMLLVLDSCEHVIGPAAELAERIFMEAPQVHILATSREALRVQGEQVHQLQPLACPPDSDTLKAEEALAYAAVKLFVDRGAAGANRFELTDADAPAVARICRELDGIALAIELAAGRLDAYGVQGIAALLNKSITMLWHGRRTAVPRHQTMSAALEWSYNLLPDAERVILRRLSVFVGAFSLEGARAVAGSAETGDAEVLEAVANLVAKSLLVGDAGGKAMRYRMLDSTRVYALRKLVDSGESFAVASRHASHYCQLLEGALLPNVGADRDRLVQQAEILGNVRAALDWSLSDGGNEQIGTALAAAAAPLLLEMSLLSECRDWMEKAIAGLGDEMRGTRREMELQASLGQSLMFTGGDGGAATRAFSRSLEIAEALQDLPFRFRLLGGLGTLLARTGDFRGALELARVAETVAQKMNDPVAQATADSMLAVALDLSGDIVEAEQHCVAALQAAAGALRTRAIRPGFNHRIFSLCGKARYHWLRGECDHAAAVAQYAIEQAEMSKHPVSMSIALIWAGSVFLWRGDWSREEEILDRLVALATKHSLSPYAAVALGLKGEVHVKRGRPELGVNLLQESLRAVRASGYEMRTGAFMHALAEGLSHLQQHAHALGTIDEALLLAERQGGYLHMPEMLRVKGEILASTPGADAQLAEQCFLDAIEWSQRQSALSWELRAASSLARHWSNQGRIDSARRLLAPVYGRFTEGHDTDDLLAARSLFAKLGSLIQPRGPSP